jgi:hypothetical protein
MLWMLVNYLKLINWGILAGQNFKNFSINKALKVKYQVKG